MTSLHVEVGNAIIGVLEAPTIAPVTFDRNTGRLFEEVDATPLSAKVIDIQPLSALFSPSSNKRSADASVDRTSWEWQAVVGFRQVIDAHAYQEALRPGITLVPEPTETFDPCRVELASVDATDPPLNAPDADMFLDIRFNVFTQRD